MTLQIYNAVTALSYDLEGSNPIKVNREGHISHQAQNGLIEERYPIIGEGTNGQDIAEETNKIIDLKTVARYYHSQTDRAAGVWLQEAATGDIYSRQALIYDISITWLSQQGKTRLLTYGNVFYGELVILRHPEWESAISQGFNQTISLRGGSYILPSYFYKGMTGARIASLIVRDPRIAGTNRNINEVWIGIREKGLGFSSFVPKQQCEIGANGPDTSNVNQTYFNGGTAKQVTFNTTPQMTNRVTFTLSNFTLSNYHHFFGEYLILLAYQHSQTPSAGYIIAQLTGENVITSPPTQLPSTGAVLQSQLIELGYIRLPAQPLRSNYITPTISNLGFSIAAERTSGTQPLFLDYIILMPARHTLKLIPTTPGQTANGAYYFFQHPENSMTAVQTYSTNTTLRHFMDFEAQNFHLPPDEAMMVFAGNTQFQHTDPNDLMAQIIVDWLPKYEKYHTA
ncbi:MAG: hypothetical protein KF770_08575 [Anaerolineae bacterium]|nr:hypothetical protein [Anaerolineae bacterium]